MSEPSADAFRTTYCAPRRVARPAPRRRWLLALLAVPALLVAWVAHGAARDVSASGPEGPVADAAPAACVVYTIAGGAIPRAASPDSTAAAGCAWPMR